MSKYQRKPKVRVPFPKDESCPRNCHEETLEGKKLFVRNGYHAVPCTGAAHSNPYIDNCMSCLYDEWGIVARKNEP